MHMGTNAEEQDAMHHRDITICAPTCSCMPCTARRWSDYNLVPNYSHWGVLLPVNVSEPNNRGAEYCAVANYSQSYTDAWGHSDTSCAGKFVALCSVSGAGMWPLCIPQRGCRRCWPCLIYQCCCWHGHRNGMHVTLAASSASSASIITQCKQSVLRSL